MPVINDYRLPIVIDDREHSKETTLLRASISDEPIPARFGWQPTRHGLASGLSVMPIRRELFGLSATSARPPLS